MCLNIQVALTQLALSRAVTPGHAESRPVTQFLEKKDCLFFFDANYANPTVAGRISIGENLCFICVNLWLKNQARKSRESNRN